MIDQSSFVFHFAGVNRPKDESEFKTGNYGLTADLLELIEQSGKKIPVLFTSSIQSKQNNPYGQSKKAAEATIRAWSKKTGIKSYIYRLPNVFGKWCKPNYNSVVATFCYNIANNLDITINDPSAKLTLVYIDDLVTDFIAAMYGKKRAGSDGFYTISRNFSATLQELAEKLYDFKASRKNLHVPVTGSLFDKFLYATFTSYFSLRDFDYKLEMKRDNRGWLAEFLKSSEAGQIFVSLTKPGISRGNHWHHTKIEKFLVLVGSADIKLRNLYDKKIVTYKVSGDKLKVVDMPAGYIHSIKNTGKKDLVTLFWANEILDPAHPDTYFKEV